MKIVEPWIQVEQFNGKQIMKNIERACRTCYRSEGAITEDSYKKLLKNCITRGHESILEHEKISVRMQCDIGVYKDLTRHRIASFSIESTRYCNYSKDKFDNQIKFIKPVFAPDKEELTISEDSKWGTWTTEQMRYKQWKECMKTIEDYYNIMAQLDSTPDQLRMLLPHSTAAEIVMTANIREWKHILELRCSKHTHPAIQQLLIPLLLKFKEDMPEIFESINYNTDFPKEKYAKLMVIENEYTD